MNSTKAVIYGFSALSAGVYVWQPEWATVAGLAVGVAAFLAMEVFEFYRTAVKHLTRATGEALVNNEDNREKMKQLTEAGMKMSTKIAEMDAQMMSFGIGKMLNR